MFLIALAALFPVLLPGLGPERLPLHGLLGIPLTGLEKPTGVWVAEWIPRA